MRLAIISDIHSNYEALTVVLREIDRRGVDAIYCLGDIVGYCADAAACVDLVMSRCDGAVRGNHDVAVSMDKGVDYLPKDAQKAAIHNREQLSDEQIDYLNNLPLVLKAGNCTFVHSTPQNPQAWMRIESLAVATEQFNHFSTDVCFIGHTHISAVMSNQVGVFQPKPGYRFLINVGSVGQPRDQNPRASVGFFDTESFQLDIVRLPYDIPVTMQKIVEAGLPAGLGKRLQIGL